MYSQEFENEFNKLKGEYDQYLEKSQKYRILVTISRKAFYLFLVLLFSTSIYASTYHILIPPTQKDGLFYVIYAFTAILFYIVPLMWLIGEIPLRRIKKEYDYSSMKKEFILIHESLKSYEKYLTDNTPIYKKRAISSISKVFQFIKDWEINFPLINKEIKSKIGFFRKDLEYIIINLMKSDKIDENKKAQDILHNMESLFINMSIDSIKTICDSCEMYGQKNIYNQIKVFIIQHQIITRIGFTVICTISVISIGLYLNVSKEALYTAATAILGISLVYYNTIRDELSK